VIAVLVTRLRRNARIQGVVVALLGLSILVLVGSVIYATLESMKLIDAVYFTVVTVTTVGFGDYCPESYWGKVFTLFFVPISTVGVAGAIQHVAAVPLQNHRISLENYVLAQFGQNLTVGDFQDIRRTAHLMNKSDIRVNDFVVAMLIRLGRIDPDDTVKIRRLFTKLDVGGTGVLTEEDIEDVIASSVDTSALDDSNFEASQRIASPAAVSSTASPSENQEDEEESMVNPLAGTRAEAVGDADLQRDRNIFDSEPQATGAASAITLGDVATDGAKPGKKNKRKANKQRKGGDTDDV
jgi:Ca2+-binding EF-hand superfamily protein